jgi:repressor LexA
MRDDAILDGDLVVVQRRSTAENGEIVVALLEDGTATLKRIYREENGFRLQPANEAMAPLFVTSVEVQGVVTGVIRRFGVE